MKFIREHAVGFIGLEITIRYGAHCNRMANMLRQQEANRVQGLFFSVTVFINMYDALTLSSPPMSEPREY